MHFVEVTIPGFISPMDRGDRFEDPIQDALEEAGIEFEYLGGGTFLGGPEEAACDFSFEVSDLKLGVEVICHVLKAAKAPPDTTIRFGDPDEQILRLGDLG